MIVLSNDNFGHELAMVTQVTANRIITIEREQFETGPITLDRPNVTVHFGRPFVQVNNLEY